MDDDLIRGVVERASGGRKKKQLATARVAEVLPGPAVERRDDWSLADPACRDRFARAVIKCKDVDLAVRLSGVPEDMAEAYQRDPEWMPRFRELYHNDILVRLGPQAAEDAIQSGPFGYKAVLDAAPKGSVDDAQAAELKALRRGGMKGRLKALDDLIREAWRQREVLSGGEYLPPDDVARIIAEVTAAERLA